MYGHRSFLVLGGGAADILSLIKGGYEILDCTYSFHQQTDDKGKITTKVFGGNINLLLSQLPPIEIIEWGINSRKYNDGCIVMVDENNIPVEKILFKEASCSFFEIKYVQTGDSYSTTRLIIHAGKLMVGDGIEFENEWIKH